MNLIIGQSIEELDRRHGFKDIKLGSTESELSDKIIFVEDANKNKIYRIKNVEAYDVFGKSLKDIKLAFNNGKLISIFLTTDYYQKPPKEGERGTDISLDEFSTQFHSFERLFGEGEFMKDYKDYAFAWNWSGKTTQLFLLYNNKMRGGSWLEIVILDYSFYEKRIKDGF